MECEDCKWCSWDCADGFKFRNWFKDGCMKGLKPVYNEEKEVWECDEYCLFVIAEDDDGRNI